MRVDDMNQLSLDITTMSRVHELISSSDVSQESTDVQTTERVASVMHQHLQIVDQDDDRDDQDSFLYRYYLCWTHAHGVNGLCLCLSP